jgi:Holliday junction resolvase RusA-like endonuclease
MISFHIPIVPPKATSQTKRLVMVAGKPRFFAKKEHQSAENDLTLLCSQHRPESPLVGPVALRVDFVFPGAATFECENLCSPDLLIVDTYDCSPEWIKSATDRINAFLHNKCFCHP